MTFSLEALKRWTAIYDRDSDPSSIWRTYHMAGGVICYFLGLDWAEKNYMTPNSPTDYFRTAPISSEDEDRLIGRVIDLGELLFNLQGVPGIEKRIEALKTAAEKVEDIVAELVAVKLFVVNGINVRFVDPIGLKGSDYDLELFLPSGEKICCDVKCKIETTSLSLATVKNALESARKQLPKDGLGCVLVKIPEQWVKNHEDVLLIVEQAAQNFFRQTSRIMSVIVYSDEFVFIDANYMGRMLLAKEYVNPKSPGAAFYKGNLLLDSEEIGHVPNWLQFHNLRFPDAV